MFEPRQRTLLKPVRPARLLFGRAGVIVRARRASLLILVALIASAAVAGAFALNGPKWGTQQVQYYVNPVNADMPEADAIAAIQAGASAWSAQSRANILPYYMGRTSASSISRNGMNEVFFRNTSAGGMYGETYWWYDSSNRLVEADIMFYDGGTTFYKGSSGCSGGVYLQDALTHEFGHALGLGHSPVAGATMYPSMLWCSMDPRTLAADDLAGIEALYPSAGANTAPTVSIAAPIAGSTAVQGIQVAFAASASDREDGNISGRTVWLSTIDGHFGTGGSISRALSVGTHGILAAVIDNAGVMSTSVTTLIVTAPTANTAPTISIAAPIAGSTAVRGTQVVFTASASDKEDGTISGRIVWLSTIDGHFGTGASVSRALSAGGHGIMAAVIDNAGVIRWSLTTLTVTAPPH